MNNIADKVIADLYAGMDRLGRSPGKFGKFGSIIWGHPDFSAIVDPKAGEEQRLKRLKRLADRTIHLFNLFNRFNLCFSSSFCFSAVNGLR